MKVQKKVTFPYKAYEDHKDENKRAAVMVATYYYQ